MTTINLASSDGQFLGKEVLEGNRLAAMREEKSGVYNTLPKDTTSNWTLPLESKHLFFTSSFFQACRNVAGVANRIFAALSRTLSDNLSQAVNVVRLTKLFDIILVPFTLSSLATHIHHFVHGSRGRIDSALNISSEVGSLGSTLTSFAMGLANLGVLSAKVLQWINPIYIVSSILSAATVPLNLRTISKMSHIRDEFDQIAHLRKDSNETNLEDFQAALKLIKGKHAQDEDFISNVFSCSEDKLMESLASIEQQASKKLLSSNLEENIQGRRLLNKALNDIRKRFHHIKVTSALAATVAIINCIGAVALLFTPAAPAVYAVIAIGVVINLSSYIDQKVQEYRFTHALGMQKKWYEWI
jgi:hypothetical protein